MNETEHRKQLLIQQIAHHRELMRLEMSAIRESNPVTPLIGSARRILGFLGVGPRRRSRAQASGPAAVSPFEVELVTTALPIVLRVLRAALSRRRAKRAGGK